MANPPRLEPGSLAWRTCSGLLQCQFSGSIWLFHHYFSSANLWMFNLHLVLLHYLHFHPSAYLVTDFHETISSPRTEWKQMDKVPRQLPHVWTSDGTLFPICFYLGNVLRSEDVASMNPWVLFWRKDSISFPWSTLQTAWVCCFHLNLVWTVVHFHPGKKGYREIQ